MKKMGLIGGMSWQSSLIYYQTINQQVQRALGGSHSCECILYSVDFAEIARLQSAGDWDAMKVIMIKAAQSLQASGAAFVVLCTNTMHKLADAIQENIQIPLLHIVDATAEQITKQNLSKVGLLATRFSMEEHFLRSRYKLKHGIDTIIPAEADRAEIHRIIYEELVQGIIKPSSKDRFLEIIDTLVTQGAQGIIAGCTEIESLIQPKDIQVELFETAKIHAGKAVELALGYQVPFIRL